MQIDKSQILDLLRFPRAIRPRPSGPTRSCPSRSTPTSTRACWRNWA